MFEKISKEKFKKIILFKYTFQLILVHFILGTIISMVIFSIVAIASIWKGDLGLKDFFTDPLGIGSGYIGSLFCGLTNILSVIPYCKLLVDCIKGGEEERIITVGFLWSNYELQTIRESKRFVCDTFSRKKNAELLLYDENKNKYRFYWNENYGELDEKTLTEKRLKIRYFKRSKIIFFCEQVD